MAYIAWCGGGWLTVHGVGEGGLQYMVWGAGLRVHGVGGGWLTLHGVGEGDLEYMVWGRVAYIA